MDDPRAESQAVTFATRLELAQTTTTSVDVLVQLVNDESVEVRRAVACNPNATEDILSRLGSDFPEEVIQNPVFNLLALENPNSLFIRLAKARSAMTSPEVLAELGKCDFREILIAVCKNPNTPANVLKDIANSPPSSLESDERYSIYAAIAHNPKATSSVLRKLSKSGVEETIIAQHPNTPVDLLENFSSWIGNSIALLKNPNLPSHIVGKLALEKDEAIQQAAQTHPQTPENIEQLIRFTQGSKDVSAKLLIELASDRRQHVRALVAVHPHTPIAVLESLMENSDWKIVSRILSNPNTNEAVLKARATLIIRRASLREDMHGCVHEAARLCAHSQAPIQMVNTLIEAIPSIDTRIGDFSALSTELLTRISQHPSNKAICERLIRYESLPSEILDHLSNFVVTTYQSKEASFLLSKIAKHPNLSDALFQKLLHSPDTVRYLVSSPHLTKDRIDQLIDTQDTYVLSRIADNPNTPVDSLFQLSQSDDEEVRRSLADNPNLPIALTQTLAKDISLEVRAKLVANPAVAIAVLDVLSKDKSSRVRGLLAWNTSTPAWLLKTLLDHEDVYVQGMIAKHQNTTPKMLLELAQRKDVSTRLRIAKRLDIEVDIIRCLLNTTVEQLIIKTEEAEREKEEAKQSNFERMQRDETIKMHVQVLALLSRHPNTHKEIRERITTDYPQSNSTRIRGSITKTLGIWARSQGMHIYDYYAYLRELLKFDERSST